eukprot:6471957-Pyramimonas_sp.AAC.1
MHGRTTLLRWLFKAEDVRPTLPERDWDAFAGRGSGAEKGAAAAGDLWCQDAVEVCQFIFGGRLACLWR